MSPCWKDCAWSERTWLLFAGFFSGRDATFRFRRNWDTAALRRIGKCDLVTIFTPRCNEKSYRIKSENGSSYWYRFGSKALNHDCEYGPYGHWETNHPSSSITSRVATFSIANRQDQGHEETWSKPRPQLLVFKKKTQAQCCNFPIS